MAVIEPSHLVVSFGCSAAKNRSTARAQPFSYPFLEALRDTQFHERTQASVRIRLIGSPIAFGQRVARAGNRLEN